MHFYLLAVNFDPRRRVEVPIAVLVALCVAIAVLALLFWSVKKRRDAHIKYKGEGPIESNFPSIAGLTHGTIVEGNKIELVQDGAYFDRVIEDIGEAKQSVHFETFLWKEGKAAQRIADALCSASTRGVTVRLLVDGSGGKGVKKRIEQLTSAGCQVVRYHPFSLSNLGRLNNRDHRKLMILDGRIGYVGGHCVTDNWLGTAQDKKHFRDISARAEGPIVHAMQSSFCENWVEECGEVPAGEDYFPQLESCGESSAHLAYTSPAGSTSSVELLHYLAIHQATKRIRLQNPYFLPDPEAIDALCAAVKNGVDVRVMMPAHTASDSPLVQHASHHKFGALLKGGVRIFEYQHTLLHQKVFAVDGVWAAIGSTNFDDRSFEVNDEVTLSVFDEKIAGQLEAIFEHDLQQCREVKLEEWKHRGPLHMMRDFSAYLINEQL